MERKVYEFISKQKGDPIIEWRICRRTGKEFPIFESEKILLEQISPTIADKKYLLSLPQLSPEARQIKRLIWRNERKFYKFIDAQGKSGISTISDQMWLRVMSQTDFYAYDHLQYGVPYTHDLFADIWLLFKHMPYPNKLCDNMENSEYCNQETDDKNCYMNAWGHNNENSLYTTYSLKGLRTVDNYRAMHCEYAYESVDIHTSQRVFFSQQIENSYDIWFSYDLKSCQNVLFGFGINNANYVFKNKIMPKEEREALYQSYKEKIASYAWLLGVIKEYQEWVKDFPLRGVIAINTENSIWWNDLINVKNSLCCTRGEESQDIAYANLFAGVSDGMDIESVGWAQKTYNLASSIKTNECFVGSHIFENVQNGYYVYASKNSDYIMACVGLDHKKCCFLNTQYTQQKWEQLAVSSIEDLQFKGKFWEFFESKDSPFPYNDSVAMDYYPIYKTIINNEEKIINVKGIGTVTIMSPENFISDAILDLGWEEKIKIKRRTKDQEINIQSWMQTIRAQDLPDNIHDVTDDILKKAIICEVSGRPFRIVWLELEFYRKHGLPLPHKHYDIRHEQRLARRSWRSMYIGHCDACEREMLSAYPSDSWYKVYCESCYDKEIYW